ncbi:TetR/AcrR family transcriptional regulator [Ovoidimarina sediminis]|uniref:TetR/AcrR family transcriptional regulator n=1 Tax=Ovoidimarina sediminis TaxID=3079856 RepID=UPI002907B024|nr:TetR/AcrR family transcriptional regulator [Rhodophyticola sp. MJ-SS7]MDU8945752.1 TetR/AcrR family transcriptional regulator [Rhodophyticola sp. MJ-SS7]
MARRSDHTRAELKDLALEAARSIVREKGVSALSTRKLADRIGYTSGTIYQVFQNRDDLVEQMNTETLRMLYAHCHAHMAEGSVQHRLRALADAFVSFAKTHPREWDAIINYPFAPEYQATPAYLSEIQRLLDLLCEAVSELYGPDQADRRLRDARLLWNGLYGIFALAIAGRLSQERSLNDAVDDLIDLYLAART